MLTVYAKLVWGQISAANWGKKKAVLQPPFRSSNSLETLFFSVPFFFFPAEVYDFSWPRCCGLRREGSLHSLPPISGPLLPLLCLVLTRSSMAVIPPLPMIPDPSPPSTPSLLDPSSIVIVEVGVCLFLVSGFNRFMTFFRAWFCGHVLPFVLLERENPYFISDLQYCVACVAILVF